MLCKTPSYFQCNGFELLLSQWLPTTKCCSYGMSVSCARRLILLYDFLSQGKGGKLPISCSDCAHELWARWCTNACVISTPASSLSIFVSFFSVNIRNPSHSCKSKTKALLNQVLWYSCFHSLPSFQYWFTNVQSDWQLATLTGVYLYWWIKTFLTG